MFEGRLLAKEALPFHHQLLLKMTAKKVHEVHTLLSPHPNTTT